MTPSDLVAAVFAGSAVALLMGGGPSAIRGRGSSVAGRGPSRGARVPTSAPAVRATALVGGLGVALLVGGVPGVAAGVMVGALVPRVVRGLRTRADTRAALLMRADLPLAGDLLAAALAAGVPPGAAAGAVGRAVGGSLGDALVRVGRATELGASPAIAWSRLVEDTTTAALARPLVRASERGAPAAAVAARVSIELRRAARDRAAAAAEVVAVRGVGPLGLCFLPAFVLLGVVPLVAGSVLAVLG